MRKQARASRLLKASKKLQTKKVKADKKKNSKRKSYATNPYANNTQKTTPGKAKEEAADEEDKKKAEGDQSMRAQLISDKCEDSFFSEDNSEYKGAVDEQVEEYER